MKIKHILFIAALFGVLGFSWPFTKWLGSTTRTNANIQLPDIKPHPLRMTRIASAKLAKQDWVDNEFRLLKSQARNIDDKVLRLALTAYKKARRTGYAGKEVLSVIDYSKASTQKRLWVFDMQRHRVLFNTWVSHGKNSGGVNSTSFSNHPGSLKSSVGVFMTGTTYFGKNGYSLRLHGLERGVNDSAYSRAIVVHGAAYASGSSSRASRGIGRSWGCPAVSSALAKPIINAIKNRSVIFAYYPGRWLSNSSFLRA